MPDVLPLAGYDRFDLRRVIIAGGSREAWFLAHMLEEHKIGCTLIERDRNRALELRRTCGARSSARRCDRPRAAGDGGHRRRRRLRRLHGQRRDEPAVVPAREEPRHASVISLIKRFNYIPLVARSVSTPPSRRAWPRSTPSSATSAADPCWPSPHSRARRPRASSSTCRTASRTPASRWRRSAPDRQLIGAIIRGHHVIIPGAATPSARATASSSSCCLTPVARWRTCLPRARLLRLGDVVQLVGTVLLGVAARARRHRARRCGAARRLRASAAVRRRDRRGRRRHGAAPHPRSRSISFQEAFATVTFSWLAVGLVGALPYLLSGTIQDPAAALFESMSGFTTTGSTVLPDIEGGARHPALAQHDAVARRHGLHRARCRDPAVPRRGRHAAVPPRGAGTHCGPAAPEDPRDRQAAVGRLRRTDRRARCALPLGGMSDSGRGEPRAHHHADRRLLDAQRVDGRVLALDPVDRHPVHVPGRDQLHAALPHARPRAEGLLERHRVAALHRHHPRRRAARRAADRGCGRTARAGDPRGAVPGVSIVTTTGYATTRLRALGACAQIAACSCSSSWAAWRGPRRAA
jgi:hypothetical protein